MTEALPPADSDGGVTPEAPAPRRRFSLWTRRLLALIAAVVATGVVLVFTIDLGRLFPQLKGVAEKAASDYLDRPMRIGRLGASILPGVFTLDDVVIDGKHPGDRPFFSAGRIYAYVPLWSIVRRQVTVELVLTDWKMTVENWPDGSSQPRLGGPKRDTPRGRAPFTTTVTVQALRGGFAYDDHMVPWSVDAPNLSFSLVRAENLKQYVGQASFTGGSVRIQQYQPMETAMSARFVLDGPNVLLRHIDLITDGSVSHVNGSVDFAHWPEQTYNVNSTVDFARMREIFFANETWALTGTGAFTGVFHLFPGGRQLAGNFASDDVTVNDLRFQGLHGTLEWTPDRFVVSHADAQMLGGDTRFDYSIAPLGKPGGSTATFEADYSNVDLSELNRLVNLRSLELAGRADGSLAISWPNGRFRTGRRGRGRTVVRQPGGVEMAPSALPAVARASSEEPRPFVSNRTLAPLSLAGDIEYTLDPNGWTFEDSWASTPHTYIAFKGRLASVGASEFPFHVTSHDWQESDRVLSRIMTAVSGPTGAIEVGGRGTFDGVMTGSFSAPRIVGAVAAESMRVWDVTWGRAEADIVIEGGYVDIAKSRFGDGPDALITADGRFALGYRRDNREEINARVALTNWPMRDLRHAFNLDDWPTDGTLGQATLVLRGKYREMFGTGAMRIDNGVAWGERFDSVTGDLDLEGSGIRIHRIEMRKGVGRMRGDARIGWDGTYAFQADGEGIPVETLDNFKIPEQSLSGQLTFKASGASNFDVPNYTFSGSVADLFVGDQGIGRVQGQLRVQGRTLFVERLVVNSGLLDVDGRGTISLNDRYDGAIHLRLTQSSVDPYLKFFAPRLSPYARAILSGSVDVVGPLSVPKDLTVGVSINDATLTLLDYELKNDGPIELAFEKQAFRVGRLRLRGGDTSLQLNGGGDIRTRAWNLSAAGNASLSILQLFFPGITTSGAAVLNASLQGSFDTPRLTGEATITNGRLRPLASIHSLEAIDGRITFDDSGVNLEGLRGRIGGGDVGFGGRIAIRGYEPSDYDVSVTGRSLTLRYPVGFNSTVNMDLRLLGPLSSPRLTGTVDVLRTRVAGGAGDSSSLLGLATAGTTGVGLAPAAVASSTPQGTQLALDVQVTAPRMYLVNNRTDRIEIMADFHLGGTFDRPAFTGRLDFVAGEFLFNGNRIFISEGSIDFTNPDRVEPILDLHAEARPRANGETYNISIGVTGPIDRFTPTVTSDPWLSEADIVSLLFGGTPNVDTAEQRNLGSPQESQQRMMQSAMATLLASPVSSRVGDVVERISQLDTVQITPLLAGDVAFQQLSPSARITLGKRIAPRLFLTYARTVGISAAQDEVILLEYEQNDRVSWVLSRNEDRSFALDFRIRYQR